jgi:hypothetical protein
MFRNKIINGAMKIDQRNAGATQTFTAGAALAYSVDRFYGYCTGANVTGARVAGSGSTQYRYQFTGAASVTAIGFGQRIEAANCYDLAGQPAVFSVDLSNSLLTTVTWTAYYANTADTFGTLASPTRTQIATGTFTVSSTLTRYSASMNIPAAATTGIEIVLTVGAQTSGTWVIGNVQLEQGTAATPFEQRFFGLEQHMCQRYTYVLRSASGASDLVGWQDSATQSSYYFRFNQNLRAQPAMTHNATGFGAGATQIGSYNSNLGTQATASSFSLSAIQTDAQKTRLQIDGLSSGSAANLHILLVGTSVAIVFSAEL